MRKPLVALFCAAGFLIPIVMVVLLTPVTLPAEPEAEAKAPKLPVITVSREQRVQRQGSVAKSKATPNGTLKPISDSTTANAKQGTRTTTWRVTKREKLAPVGRPAGTLMYFYTDT